MSFFDVVFWDSEYMKVLCVKLFVALLLFTCLRFFSGAISSINSSNELTKKDNPAFGISMAGLIIALTIVLSGTIYGNEGFSLEKTFVATALYGLLGIGMMSISRLIFDDLALPKISVRKQIEKKNSAAAIIDAGNLICTAIIIQAIMLWETHYTLKGVVAVFIGFFISQLLLVGISYLHIRLFHKHHAGKSLQKLIEKGNVALAIRFTGRRLGFAFAISAAANSLLYELGNYNTLIIAWVLISIVAVLILQLMCSLADKFIFPGTDTEEEVVTQSNVAVGVVQGGVYFALGFFLAQMLS